MGTTTKTTEMGATDALQMKVKEHLKTDNKRIKQISTIMRMQLLNVVMPALGLGKEDVKSLTIFQEEDNVYIIASSGRVTVTYARYFESKNTLFRYSICNADGEASLSKRTSKKLDVAGVVELFCLLREAVKDCLERANI